MRIPTPPGTKPTYRPLPHRCETHITSHSPKLPLKAATHTSELVRNQAQFATSSQPGFPTSSLVWVAALTVLDSLPTLHSSRFPFDSTAFLLNLFCSINTQQTLKRNNCRRVDRLVSPSWFVADLTVAEMTGDRESCALTWPVMPNTS